MDRPDREHPDLGRVCWNESLVCWEAQVEIAPGHSIELTIYAEEGWATVEPEELFAIAAVFLPWARAAEPACRAWMAETMLDGYNDEWADADPEEGHPPLDREGFMARLRLGRISLFPGGGGDWVYSESGMFGYHGLSVSMSEDRKFTDVMMFG